ncbi:MAG: hypothetical protein AB1486_19910 [Planctomycetota bacterium]
MKRTMTFGLFLLAVGLLIGGHLPDDTRAQVANPICFSSEWREILSHMSIVYLDDGYGGQLKTIRLTGVNLQVVNGAGDTVTTNGVGNVIVGYNELGHPAGDDRTGSHNVVAGQQSNYVSYGGLVVGWRNTITAPYATVTGGCENVASSFYSSVGGGWQNEASGDYSSVGGGRFNTATGTYSSVSGGDNNDASSRSSSVSGGQNNAASGWSSSVTGGYGNTAAGDWSAVSGGQNRSAAGMYDWAAGGLWQDF